MLRDESEKLQSLVYKHHAFILFGIQISAVGSISVSNVYATKPEYYLPSAVEYITKISAVFGILYRLLLVLSTSSC